MTGKKESIYFEAALVRLIGVEQGYVDHPSDNGGKTRWGITEGLARRYGYDGHMHELPYEVAAEIYRAEFWETNNLDRIVALSATVAYEVFESAVHGNPAAKWLQHALNKFNRRGKDYADIAVDGQIGHKTVDALRAYLKARGNLGQAVILKALNSRQGDRYLDIADRDERQEDFVFGWFAHRVGL